MNVRDILKRFGERECRLFCDYVDFGVPGSGVAIGSSQSPQSNVVRLRRFEFLNLPHGIVFNIGEFALADGFPVGIVR